MPSIQSILRPAQQSPPKQKHLIPIIAEPNLVSLFFQLQVVSEACLFLGFEIKYYKTKKQTMIFENEMREPKWGEHFLFEIILKLLII